MPLNEFVEACCVTAQMITVILTFLHGRREDGDD